MLHRLTAHLPRLSTRLNSLTTMASTAPITVNTHETYLSQGIPSASSLAPNPLDQFATWFQHALSDPKVIEPEAMALSTVDPTTHIPSTRVVLLKRADQTGFVFFTNYESRKGKELFPNAEAEKGGFASIAFYWRPLHLSVRVVGRAEKVAPEVTEEYFNSRPVGSRIGAWASRQSTALPGGREQLDECVREVEARFGVEDGTAKASAVDVGPNGPTPKVDGAEEPTIPVPPFWGGVRIVPFEVEFWAGRESRLHDRFRYTRKEGDGGEWEITRLAP
ncbi:hypothetical protein BCR35DRAFT_173552 [Leucosporidium creatinivorum]|uniref:pyridoxal 5'-phosphate synthase n=1 Tax=Leucosporidium creatinivorum TaxID=106004 RepID=A0A1Y2FYV7_9BASI|nr:hypothetical protein BCR35DRAFT_173552 [Leucosporidium creatinivorum]